jgi:outer membrane biosynthesis protein TonB
MNAERLKRTSSWGRSVPFALILMTVGLASGACVTQPGAGQQPGNDASQVTTTPTPAQTAVPLVIETPSPTPAVDVTPTLKSTPRPTVELTAAPKPTAKPTPIATPAPTKPPPTVDPTAAAKAAGASAICADRSWSFSKNRSGTCSKHGGVHWWTGNLGPPGPGAH